jgi:hypothetical protein
MMWALKFCDNEFAVLQRRGFPQNLGGMIRHPFFKNLDRVKYRKALAGW